MNETKKTQRRYDRFARVYDLFELPLERLSFAKIRRKTLSPLKGKVLEIGVGTGKNLPYYNWENIDYTGIDFSKKMLERAKRKNFPKAKMIYMDAQNIDFKENNFDYIVTTFVLCSIPDPIKALKEMQRLIKKDGKVIMIEHVRSKNFLLAFWQDIHNPLTKFFFGANINRDTKQNIEKAGLIITKDQALAFGDVLRLFEARKGD
ncbi:MAG: methyltransferase domain-containing protein [bacterium]|nr:methyltransferase domain-containing protein [bacterium]